MDLKEKVVVITGASNGIGKSCAIQFVKQGAFVFILDIDEKNGKELECIEKGKIKFIKTDVSVEEDVMVAKQIILQEKGKIDILINNAAKQTVSNFFNTSVEDFKEVIETNLLGVFICSKIFGNEMLNGSKIVNMLSVHSEVVRKGKYAYDASKAAIEMLTKEMALELFEKGINVLGISFGACNTPMNNYWINNMEQKEETLNKIPLKWIAEPEEIADFVINILQKFSDYTTGNIFTIDGGRSLMR